MAGALDPKPVLTRDAILNADDAVIENVNVPEWGGVVRVKSLSAKDRDELLAAVSKEDGLPESKARAMIVAMSAVDAEGKRMFTMEDVEALALKSSNAIDRIVQTARRLSALSVADVEELKKN